MANNPYTPPKAEVGDVTTESEEFQPINLWSATGRIGRLRYLAYTMAASFITIVAGGILAALLVRTIGPSLILLMYFPLIIFNILTLIKRSHDMGWSGWTVLIAMFIPFAALIWLFKAGTHGENEYGAPPPPNTTGVKVLAFLFPLWIAMIIGIMAAIAIPAYKQYMMRVQQAQQHMRQQQ